MSSSPDEKVYQLKVSLSDSKPEIWRRFVVRGSETFSHLHWCLQTVMGWENYHLYVFRSGEVEIGPCDMGEDVEWLDAEEERIDKYLKKKGDELIYEYDLGDGWEHIVTLEKINSSEDYSGELPRCLEGEQACPPEDCGGIDRFYALLESQKDKKHPQYKHYKEWLGGVEFDPAAFSVEEVNGELEGGESGGSEHECSHVIPQREYGAVVILPKKLFIQWVQKSAKGLRKEDVEGLLSADPSCWLIPRLDAFPAEEEFQSFLDRFKVDVFQEELRRWNSDSSTWPKVSSKNFDQYFNLAVHSVARPVTEINEEYETYFLEGDHSNLVRDELLQAVDNQIREGTPPQVRTTFERLIQEGIPESESKQLIASALLDEMWHVAHNGEDYDEERYVRKLHELPKTPWTQES